MSYIEPLKIRNYRPSVSKYPQFRAYINKYLRGRFSKFHQFHLGGKIWPGHLKSGGVPKMWTNIKMKTIVISAGHEKLYSAYFSDVSYKCQKCPKPGPSKLSKRKAIFQNVGLRFMVCSSSVIIIIYWIFPVIIKRNKNFDVQFYNNSRFHDWVRIKLQFKASRSRLPYHHCLSPN